jgi:purine-binding chemotaxis protein CheW
MSQDLWKNTPDDEPGEYRGIFAITKPLEEDTVPASNENARHLLMDIGNKRFLIPSSVIREIIIPPKITYIPYHPSFIEGVINLRGRILPVVNLKKMLGMNKEAVHRNVRILVCQEDDNAKPFSFIVDGVTGIADISPDSIENMTSPLTAEGLDLLAGLSRYNQQIVGILSLSKILSVLEHKIETAASGSGR